MKLLIIQVGMTINSVAQDISETGYTNAGLRDEVYIQLCKQVSPEASWLQSYILYLIFTRYLIIQDEKVCDEDGSC